jgi:hypothetical protein
MCRLYDQDGFKVGVGSRPLGKDVDEQLSDCERVYNSTASPKPVIVLADDGTYSGSSIVEAATLLKNRRIIVQKIKLGFCTNEGMDTIYKLAEEGFPALELSPSLIVDKARGHVYTWVCERDFYLGVPRSGRPYGSLKKSGRADPSENPIAFAYIEPFAASRRGGGVKRGLIAFSRDQILRSLDLWRAIEDANHVRFKVSDIPRFPGPGLEKEYEHYRDKYWTDYIYAVAGVMFCDLREPRNREGAQIGQ